jgi:nickel-type superoxide dismutase maturation protease
MGWPLLRVKVAERSMEPALRPGDWLLVRRTRRIRPGQIVLARHPGRPEMLIVKRAARRDGDGWWLASDNPDAGAVDSRRFGAVPVPLIEGRVLTRYWRPRAGPSGFTLLYRTNPDNPATKNGPVTRRGRSRLVLAGVTRGCPPAGRRPRSARRPARASPPGAACCTSPSSR